MFRVLESVCNESPGQHLLDDPRLSSYVGRDYLTQLGKNINHGQPHYYTLSMRPFDIRKGGRPEDSR